MEPKGRKIKLIRCQFLRRGALLRRLVEHSTEVLSYCLLSFPAFMVLLMVVTTYCILTLSCSPDTVKVEFVDDNGGEDEDKGAADDGNTADVESTKTKLELRYEGYAGEDEEMSVMVDWVDLFVYGNDGTRSLESHVKFEAGENLYVESGSGSPRTVVAVANCPKAFNLKALAKMDSIEQLEFDLDADNPERPLMSGLAEFTPGQDVVVTITPLLCRVNLNSVSNGLDGYELLEEPSVRLCDVTPSAKVLQFKDFRPSEVISYGASEALPSDVGYYPSTPEISLWCYPNDTPETTLGAPRTSLEFNCRILGEECSFPISLPPLDRGSSTNVEIMINGPDDWNCKVWQN